MKGKQKPPAASTAKGAEVTARTVESTAERNSKQAIVFRELLNERIWVVSDQNKAPCNSSGEPFNSWSDTDAPLMTYDEARATADKYGLPNIGIIFPATGIVHNRYRLLCLDVDEVTGYRKYRQDKPGKPGCSAITFDPATDAAGVLAKLPLVAQLPPTVWEASGSRTGLHGFLWLPEDQAARYWGRNGATLDGCAHVDTFLAGRKARHLIVTGVLLTSCTSIAKLDDITPLKPLLKLAGESKGPPELLISSEGMPHDLTALTGLSEEQHALVTIVGKDKLDRSKHFQGLLIKFNDEIGMSFADQFASVCHNEATVDYLLDHRNQDPVAAMDFARYEIARAYEKSDLYDRHRIAKYYPAWGDGELLVDPVKATAPEAPLCESLSSFMADRKPQEVLIEGILYRGDHNAGIGHPNAGKTSGVLDMALHLGFGMDFGKRKVVRSRVLYLAGEDPAGIRRRIKLWCQTHGKNIEDLDDWLYIVRRPVLDDTKEVARLKLEMKKIMPALMVTDTFSANYGGESEDKATEVKKWMKMMREDFITEFGLCAITLHHPPKGSDDIYNWRGSGVAAGDLDNIFGFSKMGNKIRMDQGSNKEAKHRTAEFEPIIWITETAPIKGWTNNLGKQETTVKATLVDDLKLDMPAAKICLAIKVLSGLKAKFSQAEVAKLAGIPAGSIAWQVGTLKKRGGLPDYPRVSMVTVKDDVLGLTKSGKALADWALVDSEMGGRIRALQPLTDGEDDDADE
ncbi:AAA family ATPase [Pseudomonas asiatica]|uniref:AAA family ATPase n=1 Tax=Pseudomonas TaxID=286 RepID=UPI0025551C7F|nr:MULTISPECIES: AAA family ATPase [Pseudomonas]MEE1917256.1 AAA family ATPase [Pseudomonas asiatica]WIV23053.1 AAA family ATPase [Pseudomonas sp. M2(2023)]